TLFPILELFRAYAEQLPSSIQPVQINHARSLHSSSLCKYPGLSFLVVLVVQVHNRYNCHSHRTWNSCIDLDFASVLLQCSLSQVRHNPANLGNGTSSSVFLFSMLESQNDLHTLRLQASDTFLLFAVPLNHHDLI